MPSLITTQPKQSLLSLECFGIWSPVLYVEMVKNFTDEKAVKKIFI